LRFFWCFLRLWATANYCRAGIKSLRGTTVYEEAVTLQLLRSEFPLYEENFILFFISVAFNPINTKFGYSFSYLVKASWNSPISFCDKKSAAILLSMRGCATVQLIQLQYHNFCRRAHVNKHLSLSYLLYRSMKDQ
jgi:hypothetical protein